MPISTSATFSLVEFRNLDEIGDFVPCNDHLRHSFTVVDDEILL